MINIRKILGVHWRRRRRLKVITYNHPRVPYKKGFNREGKLKVLFIKNLITSNTPPMKYEWLDKCWCCGLQRVKIRGHIYELDIKNWKTGKLIIKQGRRCKYQYKRKCNAIDKRDGNCKDADTFYDNYEGSLFDVFLDKIILPLFCGDISHISYTYNQLKEDFDTYFMRKQLLFTEYLLLLALDGDYFDIPNWVFKQLTYSDNMISLKPLRALRIIITKDDWLRYESDIREKVGLPRFKTSFGYMLHPYIYNLLQNSQYWIVTKARNKYRSSAETVRIIITSIQCHFFFNSFKRGYDIIRENADDIFREIVVERVVIDYIELNYKEFDSYLWDQKKTVVLEVLDKTIDCLDPSYKKLHLNILMRLLKQYKKLLVEPSKNEGH